MTLSPLLVNYVLHPIWSESNLVFAVRFAIPNVNTPTVVLDTFLFAPS